MTFDELYKTLLKSAVRGEKPQNIPQEDKKYLDFLMNPRKYAPILALQDCADCGEGSCGSACLFGALERSPEGKIVIDPAKCSGCESCLAACKSGKLAASRDVLPALYDIKKAKGPVYALVAPSVAGQFSEKVTAGKLRSAFRALGFEDMVEVALFADILTLNEALRFSRHIHNQNDFQLTSCCCPVWISLIRDSFEKLSSHTPGAVSPMIAAGRTVKVLHPNALTVFIGPCMAKKSEARLPELAGAVDWVLTYRELWDVFEAADIHPEQMEDLEQGHASRLGRIYGRAGGVGEAVNETFRRLHPDSPVQVRVAGADGTSGCKALIERIKAGDEAANYYEGMGCSGGCVGGPGVIIDKQQGREKVETYGGAAEFATPADNPYVAEMLRRLGFETVSDFLDKSALFARDI